MKQYLAWIQHSPKKVIAATFICLMALSLGIFQVKTNFGIKFWFKTHDPHLEILSRFEKEFGEDNNLVVVIHNNNGIDLSVIRTVTQELAQAYGISQVLSLANYPIVKNDGDEIYFDELENGNDLNLQINQNPELVGQFVDKKLKTSIVVGKLKPSFDQIPDYQKIISDAQRRIEEIRNSYPENALYLTGIATVVDQFRHYAFSDLLVVLPLLSLGILLLMFYAFRSTYVSIAPFSIFLFSTAAAFGLSGYLGIPFHNISAVIPGILVTLAFADTMHVLNGLRQGSRKGEALKLAVLKSAEENFVPTLLTTLTTALGLFSFLSADLDPLRGIGLIAGLGTCLLWIATFGLLVPVLYLFPPNLKNVRSTFFDRLSVRLPKKLVFTVFSFILIPSLFFLFHLKVNTNPVDYFPKTSGLAKAQKVLEQSLGGLPGAEVVLDAKKENGIWDPQFIAKIQTLEKKLLQHPRITGVKGPLTIIRKLNRALAPTRVGLPRQKNELAELFFLGELNSPENFRLNDSITVKKDKLRLSLFWEVNDSRTALKTMDEIEHLGEDLDLAVKVTGKFPLYYRMTDYVFSTFTTSLALSLGMVFFVFLIILKDFKMALLSMLPNIVPIVIGLGTLGALGIPIDTTICMAASVCLGLAVDDTIHLIYKYREGGETAFRKVIPTLALTSASLVVGFALFYFSEFVPNKGFGLLCAWIISWALLTDIYLLPLLLEFKKKEEDNERKHYRADAPLVN